MMVQMSRRTRRYIISGESLGRMCGAAHALATRGRDEPAIPLAGSFLYLRASVEFRSLSRQNGFPSFAATPQAEREKKEEGFKRTPVYNRCLRRGSLMLPVNSRNLLLLRPRIA